MHVYGIIYLYDACVYKICEMNSKSNKIYHICMYMQLYICMTRVYKIYEMN